MRFEQSCRPPRPFAALACVAALLLSGPAGASHIGESLAADEQLVATTSQLLSALAQWERTPAAQRAAGALQLAQLAQQRQQQMISLLQRDPSVAAARMLPRSLVAKLPAQAAAYVEQEVRVQGNAFAHVADNFATGQSRASFKLQGTSGGTEFNVFMADAGGDERDLRRMAGKRASFPALRVGDNLVILDKKQVQLQAADGSTTSTGTVVAATTAVQGNQNTLSILLNFSDKAVSCTAADVSSRLFGSTGSTVNNNYAQSSLGKVSFSGQVVGPFTINYTSTGSCDYGGWATAANAAAKAAGFDPALYQRVNYVTPSNSTCGWSGLAYMPGKQSWVQSCSATGVFSHELGHNLSLHHSATPTSEYGDGSDPMGGARVVMHNGANRAMAGWVPAGMLVDVAAGGTYALSSISTNAATASPQVLRIAKPDTGEYYYVSLRQALGLDAGLSSTYLNTVAVHRSGSTLPSKTFLLQNLSAGQSFVDSVNGITIASQGVVNGVATVDVAFGGGSCVRAAPLITVTPASQSAVAGATVNYTVSVTNTNPSLCGTSTFNLTQTLPAGFSGSFGNAAPSIAAGASASATWSVSSTAQVGAATYTLTASAADATGGLAASAHASDIVYVDTAAPTVDITSPLNGATLSPSRITIAAAASDDMGVQSVEIYVDGVLLARDTAAPYTATWNARKAGIGSHTILVRAIDGAGNRAEKASVVQLK